MPLSDLLDEPRSQRADAAPNFDTILTAARAEFTEHGTDAALDDIARRARKWARRPYTDSSHTRDLNEAVYLAEVDALCQDTFRLAAEGDPSPALVAWVCTSSLLRYQTRPLVEALDRESGTRRAHHVARSDADPRPTQSSAGSMTELPYHPPIQQRQPRYHERLPAGHRLQRDHQDRPRTAIPDDLRHRRAPAEAVEGVRAARPASTRPHRRPRPRLANLGSR
jgi:hypothetical protein